MTAGKTHTHGQNEHAKWKAKFKETACVSRPKGVLCMLGECRRGAFFIHMTGVLKAQIVVACIR